METKELINKLEKTGFTTYESKVFLVLYQGYRMSAAEIAKEARIPRPSVYEILGKFAKQGICVQIETPAKQIFEVVDSNVIESKLRLDIDLEHKKRVADLDDCFRHIKPVYKSKRSSEYKADVELLKGYNKYREQKFIELVKASSNGILLMNRFRGNVDSKLDKVSRDFYKRGGKVKSIYEASTDFKIKINDKWENVSKEGLIKICEGFTKQGEQIRFLDEVPQIMAVFDEKIVYINLYDENIRFEDLSDVIIKNKRFAKFMTGLFNMYWDKANAIEIFKKQIYGSN